MSAEQVIEEFKELSPVERARVVKFVVENDDSWIPGELKQDLEKELSDMAGDPQIQRELRSINAEFAAAESDGLSKI